MRYNVFNEFKTPLFLNKENPFLFSKQAFPKDGILRPSGGDKLPSYFMSENKAAEAIRRTKKFLRAEGVALGYYKVKPAAESGVSLRILEAEDILAFISKFEEIKVNNKSVVVDDAFSRTVIEKGNFKDYSLNTLIRIFCEKTNRKIKLLNKLPSSKWSKKELKYGKRFFGQ